MELEATVAKRSSAVQMGTGGLIGLAVVMGVIGFGYMMGGDRKPEMARASAVLTITPNDPVRRLARSWDDVTATENGKRLPIIAKDGGRVFDLFRRPADGAPALAGQAPKPQIAIMITGLGYNIEASQAMMATLPFDAGIAVTPAAPYASRIVQAARENGREIWLHAPSESEDPNVDEGTDAIMVNSPATLNLARLHNALGGLTHYVGVVLSPQSRLVASNDDLDPVLKELGQRGLGFAKLSPAPRQNVQQLAAQNNVPYLPFALNLSAQPAAIAQRLNDLQLVARESGYAIAVVTDPNPVVLKALLEWIDAHRNTDFVLVPPSSIAAAASAAQPRAPESGALLTNETLAPADTQHTAPASEPPPLP